MFRNDILTVENCYATGLVVTTWLPLRQRKHRHYSFLSDWLSASLPPSQLLLLLHYF